MKSVVIEIFGYLVPITIALLVFAQGLRISTGEVQAILKERPGQVLRSLIAILVLVPAVAVALILALKPAVGVGIGLAWAGLGVHALVAAWLVQAAVALLASLSACRHPMMPLLWYARAGQTLALLDPAANKLAAPPRASRSASRCWPRPTSVTAK